MSSATLKRGAQVESALCRALRNEPSEACAERPLSPCLLVRYLRLPALSQVVCQDRVFGIGSNPASFSGNGLDLGLPGIAPAYARIARSAKTARRRIKRGHWNRMPDEQELDTWRARLDVTNAFCPVAPDEGAKRPLFAGVPSTFLHPPRLRP